MERGTPLGGRQGRDGRGAVALLAAVAVLVVGLATVRAPAARAGEDTAAACDGVRVRGDGRSQRGSVCVGRDGEVLAAVGGNVPRACGTVIVAGVNVLDGPTAGPGPDPERCPHPGGPVDVHDPAIAEEGGWYYLFGTGPGIPVRRSRDLRSWTPVGPALPGGLPGWATTAVPGAVDPWAPDIAWFDGAWHLYYSVSTFGSKISAIGLATASTLDPADPAHGWTDQGLVVRSDLLTDHNAIDPNVLVDGSGVWLTWGSFWGGIKQVPLDPATGRPPADAVATTVASRLVPTWGIEAPSLVERDGWYYLFTSWDHCCRGVASTYEIRVGRARSAQGPFVDARGVPLLLGGGTLVLEGEGARRGPGHQAVVRTDDRWLLAFHWYDAERRGLARLGTLPIRWTTEGWPTVDWDDA